MKKKLFFIIQICIVLIAAKSFYSCNDTIESDKDDRVKGVSVVPNPMTVGQSVIISGPGFKDATRITFPGGVSVTNFTKAGEFQLNAIVPQGAASEGKISVALPGGEFVLPFDIVIFTTKGIQASTMEVNPVTKNYVVGPNDNVSIRGQGLGPIVEIVLPGGLSISSMNFAKKTDISIDITIPMGGFDRKAVEPLKLIGQSGEVFYTVNTLEWGGEGFVPPELLILCGRSFKVWEWNLDAPRPFGNGGYNVHFTPQWWYPSVQSQFPENSGHGISAKMEFHLPNKFVLRASDGQRYEGKFIVDVSRKVGTWSIAMIEIVSGPDFASLIGGTRGTYNTNPAVNYVPKTFDLLSNHTGTNFTVSHKYPQEATSNFYLYRIREDEGEGSKGK